MEEQNTHLGQSEKSEHAGSKYMCFMQVGGRKQFTYLNMLPGGRPDFARNLW